MQIPPIGFLKAPFKFSKLNQLQLQFPRKILTGLRKKTAAMHEISPGVVEKLARANKTNGTVENYLCCDNDCFSIICRVDLLPYSDRNRNQRCYLED